MEKNLFTNTINILDEIHNDAITIGNEVNLSRAFPSVRDGLKPSQRAVIFTAYDKKYISSKPHVKSAKLDGDCTGTYWPHGSEYPTIVRLTQPFVMNIPLLDMHGSNGSQMGTPEAAASRYTEVRLSEACENGLLKNLDKNTTDWIPNYSEDREWPSLFPAVMPNLFVNGSDGLGYCYSQSWLPGNLNEFTEQVKNYLKTKNIDCSSIYPDFPTNGIIINKNDIHTIYETGAGTVILRGKAAIENNIIRITELPYQVYVTPFMEQLKKLVTPDSRNETKIPGVNDIYNISGDTGINIEIECETNPEIILNKLYQYSDLQINLSANQYALIDGIPELLTLKDYIKTYVEHNIACLKREYTFDLNKAQTRLEIVDGLVKALEDIDNIITVIKKSKSSTEAVTNLIKKYKFTENQAKAIVDMKLGKLANLETVELNEEQQALNKTIEDCNAFLKSDKDQKKEFIKRLEDFTKKYGWDRRTQLDQIDIVKEKAVVKEHKQSNEQYMVALTKGNNIKRIKLSDYRPAAKIKNESEQIINAVKVESKDKVILLSASGKMYKLQASKIALGNMNNTGNSLEDLFNDKIIAIYSGQEEEQFIFFITKQALVKKMNSTEVFGISKNVGTTIMKLNDDEIIYITLTNDTEIPVEINGKSKVINTAKFNTKGRNAGGQIGIKLKEGQTISIKN